MASDLARYITSYYGKFMTASEGAAHNHLIMTITQTHGPSDFAAQTELYGARLQLLNPAILELVREGYDTFLERTALRILTEHSSEIFINTCPKCGALKRTPLARPCRHCKSWNEPTITEVQREKLGQI